MPIDWYSPSTRRLFNASDALYDALDTGKLDDEEVHRRWMILQTLKDRHRFYETNRALVDAYIRELEKKMPKTTPYPEQITDWQVE